MVHFTEFYGLVWVINVSQKEQLDPELNFVGPQTLSKYCQVFDHSLVHVVFY